MSIVVKQRPATSTSSAAAHLFSPIPACFRRARSVSRDAPSTTTSTSTSVYATDSGACVLTWTRTLLGRTLRIQLQKVDCTIKIRGKPFLFWRNQGMKSFDGEVQILWDFRRCKFGSETEAESGFYLAVAVGGELALLIGDSAKPVYTRLRLEKDGGKRKRSKKQQRLVLKKEHACGTRFFRAAAALGNSKVMILIEHFYSGRDSGLRISFNGACVLVVEHLVWKFRGSEQVEYEGVCVNVSWDVYGWLFCSNSSSSDKIKKRNSKDVTMTSAIEGNGSVSGSGVFVFDFEKVLEEDEDVSVEDATANNVNANANANALDRMRKSEMSLWSSLSSISSSRSSTSSVMDWWSAEEKEMGCGGVGGGFSLVVYAIKS